MAAATRVHRRNQLKARMIADMRLGPRHLDTAGFNRLAQGVEGLPRKFRQLIQKQNTAMGERNFARLGIATAADQSRHGG